MRDADKFEKANICYKIAGYFVRPPGGLHEVNKTFEKSKNELIAVLKRDIQVIESMTLETFQAYKKKGFKS